MLERARAKFPEVPVEKLGLQELAYEGTFDAIVCIDVLELLPPEDWSRVLTSFRRALVPGGLLYFTVELPEEDLPVVYRAAVEAGLPVVEGEYVKDGGYHYYPEIVRVGAWVDAAGFDTVEDVVGDGYHHFLARGNSVPAELEGIWREGEGKSIEQINAEIWGLRGHEG